jgi:DNA-binding CsgD family transcriptional regulator
MDHYFGDILAAKSLALLRQALERYTMGFGYRYFMYRGWFAHSRHDERDLYFDNCSQGWHAYYERHLHNGSDPLHLQAVNESKPILWRQLSPRSPDFYARAREFGLVTGSTHPVHGPGARWSSISFIRDRDGNDVEKQISATLGASQLIAIYAHDAVARIVKERCGSVSSRPRKAPLPLILNDREREVLGLAAGGHTNSKIAGMLSISDRTVVFHLRNAREKLGASNCVHAVSKALSLGLIASA